MGGGSGGRGVRRVGGGWWGRVGGVGGGGGEWGGWWWGRVGGGGGRGDQGAANSIVTHTTYLGVLPVDVVNDEQLKSNKKTCKIK